MTTVGESGRLGNRIIRNLAVSLLAKKYNLQVNYCDKELISKLGIELYSGSHVYENTVELTDSNYFKIYNYEKGNFNYNLYAQDFFQTKEITNLLYNYLNTDKIKSNIIKKNQFNERYNRNNDLFIHVRLTDTAQWNPGITYYINAINSINYDNLYLSTDEINHNIIIKLKELYPSLQLIKYDEIATFKFSSTCKHIILSHGSFSAVIGYLSFFSNIYYPEYELEKTWYGDMFSINSDNWKKLSVS
jgi:hypothetical protein